MYLSSWGLTSVERGERTCKTRRGRVTEKCEKGMRAEGEGEMGEGGGMERDIPLSYPLVVCLRVSRLYKMGI